MNICLEFPELPKGLDPIALSEALQLHQILLQEAFNEIALLSQQNSQLRAKCKRLASLLCPVN